MNIHFLDKHKILRCTIDTQTGQLSGDTFTQYLSTGASSLKAKILLDDDDLALYSEEGCYVAFIFKDKLFVLQIKTTSDVEVGERVEREIYCECDSLTLFNTPVRATALTGTLRQILTQILFGTNYKIGHISDSIENIVGTVELKDSVTSVYTVLQSLIGGEFGNIEMSFRWEIVDSLKGKINNYIDIYADGELGEKTYNRIEYDWNSYGTSRKGDISDFCNALLPTGANNITIADLEWTTSHGYPLDKPKGQDYLVNPDSVKYNDNPNKLLINTYSSNATTPGDLIWETYYKLMDCSTRKFSYEVPLYLTDQEIENYGIGDTVYVVNPKFTPAIYLEARIGQLDISFSGSGDTKATLSNYKELNNGIKKWTKADFVKDTIGLLSDNAGKLTQAQIDEIHNYLNSIVGQQKEIDEVIQKIEDERQDTVIKDSENEDYNVIHLDGLSGGVWFGDERMKKVVDEKCNYSISYETPSDTNVMTGYVYNVKTCVNVRNTDTISSDTKIGTIPKGSKVSVLGVTDKGWYKVQYGDLVGFVSDKCIYLENSNGDIQTPTNTNSDYETAKKYYAKFSLGTYANSSSLAKLMSKSNTYHISTLVDYYSEKFGLDPSLVYCLIMAESSGNPSCATKSSGGGYGLMQCERSVYFNKTQTIKYLNGYTFKFTPSYSTMSPNSGGTKQINGVTVKTNIANQIMFGCYEFRKSLEYFQGNIFASLCGYNFGLYGTDWCICRYEANKHNIKFVDKYGYKCQSSTLQKYYFEDLSTYQCPWSNQRKVFKSMKGLGTPTNIEYYLRWYKSINGQLPYVVDSKGNKVGYGVSGTATSISTTPATTTLTNVSNTLDTTITTTNTTTTSGIATTIRNKIVAKGKEIAELHQKYKKATYCGSYAIYDDSKRYRAPGTINGVSRPYCYVCSSLTSCAYKYAGLTSIVGVSHANCNGGTLVKSATAKSGYLLEKLSKDTIKDLLPGDLLMISNGTVPSNLTVSWAGATNGAYRKDKGTHHVILYCGEVNGVRMICHASGNYYPTRAIRYEKMFDCYSSNYWYTHGIILRPWDLAQADKKATTKNTTNNKGENTINKTTTEASIIKNYDIFVKALDNAVPSTFFSADNLLNTILYNGELDDTPLPATASHVFVHLGVHCLDDNGIADYISFLQLLQKKYPKTPIFVAEEYDTSEAGINFNTQLYNYANETQYVIYLGKIDNFDGLNVTSGKAYYNAYKKALLDKVANNSVDDDTVTTTPVEDTPIKISGTLSNHSVNDYSDKLANDISFTLPSKVSDTYWSKLIFTTANEDIKFSQSKIVKLEGDDCTNGALVPQKSKKYTIINYYNPDGTPKYLGIVSSTVNGVYEITERKTFIGAEDVIKLAETYYTQRNEFYYSYKTPCSFSNPDDNKDKWVEPNTNPGDNGRYHIDCSTFAKLIFMGLSYENSPYAKKTTKILRNTKDYSWTLEDFPRLSNAQAKYCVAKGWQLTDVTQDTIEEIPAGALIFYDRDNKDADAYLGISHVAICIGKQDDGTNWCIESTNYGTNSTNVPGIRKIAIKDNYSDKIILVAYPKKY